jgi:hypothetical protein
VTIETLVILALATWYTAYALSSTHGPGGVFDWIREHVWHGRTSKRVDVGERGNRWEPQKNGLLDCPVCLAFWVALLLVTVTIRHVDIVQTLAVAGLAMILHSWSGWRFGNE